MLNGREPPLEFGRLCHDNGDPRAVGDGTLIRFSSASAGATFSFVGELENPMASASVPCRSAELSSREMSCWTGFLRALQPRTVVGFGDSNAGMVCSRERISAVRWTLHVLDSREVGQPGNKSFGPDSCHGLPAAAEKNSIKRPAPLCTKHCSDYQPCAESRRATTQLTNFKKRKYPAPPPQQRWGTRHHAPTSKSTRLE